MSVCSSKASVCSGIDRGICRRWVGDCRPFMATDSDTGSQLSRRGKSNSPASKTVVLPFLKGVTVQSKSMNIVRGFNYEIGRGTVSLPKSTVKMSNEAPIVLPPHPPPKPVSDYPLNWSSHFGDHNMYGRALRSPARSQHSSKGLPPMYGLPPMQVTTKTKLTETLANAKLQWRIVKMSGNKIALAVYTETETIQLRQLSANKSRDWGTRKNTSKGCVLMFCRGVLGGTIKQRGWLGIGSGITFFIADGDTLVDTILLPEDITELVRDDTHNTVDIRYSYRGKAKAAVLGLHKHRLDDAVASLVTICDETSSGGQPSADETLTRNLSPARPETISHTDPQLVSVGGMDGSDTRPSLSAALSSSKKPTEPISSPGPKTPSWWVETPLPANVDNKTEYGPLADSKKSELERVAAVIDPAAVNYKKWKEAGYRMGGGKGPKYVNLLKEIGKQITTRAVRSKKNLLDEILDHVRCPSGCTYSEVVRNQAALLYKSIPSVSQTHSPVETFILRLLSQGGADTDLFLGFPEPSEESRNTSLYATLCQVMCSAWETISQGGMLSYHDLSDSYSNLICYLFTAVEPIPSGVTLFRPAVVTASAYTDLITLQPGQLYSWGAPAACTSDAEIAESVLEGEDEKVLFIIRGELYAVPVHIVSKYPREMEVMLPPLSVFEVINVYEDVHHLTIELQPRGTAVDGDQDVETSLHEILNRTEVSDQAMQRPKSVLVETQEEQERSVAIEDEGTWRRLLEKLFFTTLPPAVVFPSSTSHVLSEKKSPQRSVEDPQSPERPLYLGHSLDLGSDYPPHNERVTEHMTDQQTPPRSEFPPRNVQISPERPKPSTVPFSTFDDDLPPPATPAPPGTAVFSPGTASSYSSIAVPHSTGNPTFTTPNAASPGGGDDTESATLKSATQLIRSQAAQIKKLEWQVRGLEQVLKDSDQQSLLAKLEETMKQRNILIAERDHHSQTVSQQEEEAIKRKILYNATPTDILSLSTDELRRRFVALQTEFKRLEGLEEETINRCRERIDNEVLSRLEVMREQCSDSGLIYSMSENELRSKVMILVSENRKLSEQNQGSEHLSEMISLKEENKSLLRELESRDTILVRQLQAAARLEAGLPAVIDTQRSVTVSRSIKESIGLIHDKDDWRTVVEVVEGSPAWTAGIQGGVYLVSADGVDLKNQVEDYQPSSKISQLSLTIQSQRSLIGSVDAPLLSPSPPLVENTNAIETAWETIKRDCDVLRHLYLLRQSIKHNVGSSP